jgi:hypothetical protein
VGLKPASAPPPAFRPARFFELMNKQSISDLYTRIQEELRNQYSIRYVSDFRHIVLTEKKSGLTVQARQAYYPAVPAEPPHS